MILMDMKCDYNTYTKCCHVLTEYEILQNTISEYKQRELLRNIVARMNVTYLIYIKCKTDNLGDIPTPGPGMVVS